MGPISSSLCTIYNHKNKARIDYLEGKSPIEALIFKIRKSEFMHQIQNEDGNITFLFLAHPDSIKLAHMYNTTYILDCMLWYAKLEQFKFFIFHREGARFLYF